MQKKSKKSWMCQSYAQGHAAPEIWNPMDDAGLAE